MNAFLTYDISARQDDVKREMIRLGYFDRWESNGNIYNLPDTSLWKVNTELKASLADLRTVIDRLNTTRFANQENIQLLRCIALSTNPWDGIVGVPR